MWEMPLWMLFVLIAVISGAMYMVLRPLKVLSATQWTVSHIFMFIGLLLVIGWLWFNKGEYWNVAMLGGGLWTTAGGICLSVVYVIRRLK